MDVNERARGEKRRGAETGSERQGEASRIEEERRYAGWAGSEVDELIVVRAAVDGGWSAGSWKD